MRSMDSTKSRSLFIVFLLALSLCLTFFIPTFDMAVAAQPEESVTADLVESAKKEGELLLYSSWSVQEAEKMFKKFQEKYPFIKTVLYRGTSESLLTRIEAESRSRKHLFDVVSLPTLTIEVFKRKKIITKYISPQEKYFPEIFKDPEGYWVAAYYMLNVAAYNTKLVAPRDVPRTYEDLLDPKWKGNIGMDSGAFYWFADILKIMGEEKGLKYMKRLSEQQIKFRNGRSINSQLVAAGEISIALPVYNHSVERVKSQGGPIEWVGLEPIVVEINSPSISANAPHPHAAKLFIDFMLSRQGQEVIASFGKLSARNDVEALLPRAKAEGIKISRSDPTISDNYTKYSTLFRDVLMKK